MIFSIETLTKTIEVAKQLAQEALNAGEEFLKETLIPKDE